MTKQEIEELSKLPEMYNAILIGTPEERHKYYRAIVGFDKEKGIFKYDYNLLVECFADQFKESSTDDEEDYNDHITEAVEWVDYNVIRALPYWEHAPEIIGCDEDCDD